MFLLEAKNLTINLLKFIITYMKNNTEKSFKLLLGLFGLVAIVLLAILIPSSPDFLKGQLQTKPVGEDPARCASLTIRTIPSPIRANESATLIIETTPSTWPGSFTVSSSSGSLVDARGTEGTLIETPERVVNFSGGETGSSITVQAENSEVCIATAEVQPASFLPCQSLTISTYPEPPPANESLEITITPSPEDWNGSYLIEADSGKLTLTNADPSAKGINTSTLITALNKIIYNGGATGEKLSVSALGEGNERCKAILTIGTE